MDLPKLDQNVGPLPLGVWVLVIGGGLGVSWFINRRTAARPSSGSGSGGGMPYLPPASDGGPVVVPGGPSDNIGLTPPGAPADNAAWKRAAQNWLVGVAGTDPLTAWNALTKYLDGLPLGTTEAGAVDKALRQFGPPPEGAPVIIQEPPTAPVPTPTPSPPNTPPPLPALIEPHQWKTLGTHARVRAMFAWYGIPLASATESANDRVKRIAAELNGRTRTWDQLTHSLQQQAAHIARTGSIAGYPGYEPA